MFDVSQVASEDNKKGSCICSLSAGRTTRNTLTTDYKCINLTLTFMTKTS